MQTTIMTAIAVAGLGLSLRSYVNSQAMFAGTRWLRATRILSIAFWMLLVGYTLTKAGALLILSGVLLLSTSVTRILSSAAQDAGAGAPQADKPPPAVTKDDLAAFKRAVDAMPEADAAKARSAEDEKSERIYAAMRQMAANIKISPWESAFEKRDFSALQLQLAAGGDVNAPVDDMRRSALIAAAGTGDVEMVDFMLQRGAKLDHASYHGNTALCEAAQGGHLHMVKHLTALGADVNQRGYEWGSALMHAAQSGHLEMLNHLIDCGADIDYRPEHVEEDDPVDYDGATALALAVMAGHAPVVRRLLDLGADLHYYDGVNMELFDYAEQAGNQEVIEWLKKTDAYDPDA